MDATPQQTLLRQLEGDVERFEALALMFREDAVHTRRWNRKFLHGTRRLLTGGGKIDREVLENFRRYGLFVGDNPRSRLNAFGSATFLRGSRRGERALMRKCLRILENAGSLDLLRKYPCSEVGNPFMYQADGLRFTHRWFKHIYALSRLRRHLGTRLEPGFTALDIGGSYGIFQSLLYQEYPRCRQVLVDLPEQLLLARYFLGTSFPEAAIAGVQELAGRASVSRELIKQYDFVLLPAAWYDRLEPGSIDLVTSFACLGELKREFFDYYVQAPVFRTAHYLYTINPFTAASFRFEDSDITILDYPIRDRRNILYFDLCPAYFHSYRPPRQKFLFFYEVRPLAPFFEYIGLVNGNHEPSATTG